MSLTFTNAVAKLAKDEMENIVRILAKQYEFDEKDAIALLYDNLLVEEERKDNTPDTWTWWDASAKKYVEVHKPKVQNEQGAE